MTLKDREALRRYQADWYADNKRRLAVKYAATLKWLQSIKLDRGCEWILADGSVCGYREHPVALEFDHRDPSQKRFDISQRLGCHRHVLLAEIAKCDVLCSNHHQIRTAMDGHFGLRREVTEESPQLALFEESA